MTAKQITENKKATTKKTLLLEVSLQISTAVLALREKLGEKKFDKRVKKAAKLLIEGIKETAPKKVAKTKVVSTPKVPSPSKKAASPKKKVIKAVEPKKVTN
jgi:hypothetical protein